MSIKEKFTINRKNMEHSTRRTIKEVLNCQTGECVNSDDFFLKSIDELTVYRSELQKAIENFRPPLFTCYYCKQKVRIRGGVTTSSQRKADVFHFAHLKDSDNCHIKTQNNYTKEEVQRIKYNGAKESLLHQKLKGQIADLLLINQEKKKEVSFVEIEKVIRDKVAKEWKKPDINALFLGKRIAIELQLSTTWLDVITKRQHFYKEQGIYILWVFHTFNINDYVRKLTYNDVVYTNNKNAFVFDKEAYDLSIKENDLILKCFYKTYIRKEHELGEVWDSSFIRLSDLTFDEKNIRTFFKNTETQKKEIEMEIEDYVEGLRESRRVQLLEEQRREKERKDLEDRINNLAKEIDEINNEKNNYDLKINKAEFRISAKKQFSTRISEHIKDVFEYFLDDKLYGKPFYDNNELLELLQGKFSKSVKAISQEIIAKKQEQILLDKNLSSINKIVKVEVSGIKYSSIDNFSDWYFIERHWLQVRVIHKNSINGLFAINEMKEVKTKYELLQLQYSKDYLFLIDLSPQILEFSDKKVNNKKFIEQQETILYSISEEIKKELELHSLMEITKEEGKIKNYLFRQNKLGIEVEKMKAKLSSLRDFQYRNFGI